VNSISANLNIMIKASEKASKVIIRDFGEIEKLQVSKKGPEQFTTNSILKAEKIIIDELKRAKPNYSVLSEKAGIKYNRDKKNIWIISPMNGIINFLRGIPHFSISIALKHDNEIISGLIFDPIKNEMFYAEKNQGAYFNNHRARVSKKNKIKDCLIASGDKLIGDSNINYRKLGSPALDMAYVATGRFDGYFQKNLHLSDIAAGIVMIKEAGGIMNELDLNLFDNLNIIISSPNLDKLLISEN